MTLKCLLSGVLDTRLLLWEIWIYRPKCTVAEDMKKMKINEKLEIVEDTCK